MALIVETAELVEHFQWMKQKDSFALTKDKLTAVEEELANTGYADAKIQGAHVWLQIPKYVN